MTQLSDDRFAEKTTAHLRRLAETSDAVRRMYEFDPRHENLPPNRDADLFLEKQLTQTKGVVYKYLAARSCCSATRAPPTAGTANARTVSASASITRVG